MTNEVERQLWRVGRYVCVMISCCTGAELQVRDAAEDGTDPGGRILQRELYPSKSDLYERARDLKGQYDRL